MNTAMSLSEVSLINAMQRLEIIGHNMANINTAGFKREMAVARFDQLLQGEMMPLGGLLQGSRGQITPAIERMIDFSGGALRYTGNPLDIAIEGDGYFELKSSQGLRYSRAGSFSVDESGRLTNAKGLVVSGEEGEILLHGGEILIDREGRVHEGGEYVGQLKLVRFADPSAATKVGDGLMKVANDMSAEAASGSAVRQGYQEASNVRVMDEMVQMMEILRHFETTSRVIKGYDEMVGTAISTIAEF